MSGIDVDASAFEAARDDLAKKFKEHKIGVTTLKDRLKIDRAGVLMYLSRDSITSHARVMAGAFAIGPGECSIAGPGFIEVMVQSPTGRIGIAHRPERTFRGPAGTGVRFALGDCSLDFLAQHRWQRRVFRPYQHRIMLGRFSPKRRGGKGKPRANIDEDGFRPYTLRITGLKTDSGAESIRAGLPHLDAALFHLAREQDLVLEAATEWDSNQLPRSSFRPGPKGSKDAFRVPSGRLNPSLCRYYHRALAATDPVNRFLALYQVLEHEFLKVADRKAKGAIERSVKKYVSDGRDGHLEDILKSASKHQKTVGDEASMLEGVLEKIVTEVELRAYIKAYEKHIHSNAYTKANKSDLFGKRCWVSAQDGLVHGEVATRIKHLRNVLVHSSDRHERGEVFVPGDKEMERLVMRETPLVQYLAEQAVLQSASFGEGE